MELTSWPAHMALALILGALIGLEREINERKDVTGDGINSKVALLGLRTFSLVAGLGAISGLLYFQFFLMSAILALALVSLLLVFYNFDSKLTQDIGITTEISLLYSFMIGFLLAVNVIPAQVIIAVTVVLVLLMSRKRKIKQVVDDINRHEINAFVSFAILAFVILPFLPNETYALSDSDDLRNFLGNVGVDIGKFAGLELFNPFKLWFIVVLITGVDLLGYVLERLLGKKSGWLLTSLIGGFVSSTATTISIAQESKKTASKGPLVAGAILATMVSFLPIAFLLITLNATLFVAALPVLLVIALTSLAVGIYFLRTSKDKRGRVADESKIAGSHQIFNLVAALKFVGIYLAINIISKIAIELFGDAGFLATTALGALTGIDAVVINAAQLAGNRIDVSLGVWGIILANAVNLLAKSAYSYLQGSKTFALQFFMSMLIVIGASLVAGVVF